MTANISGHRDLNMNQHHDKLSPVFHYRAPYSSTGRSPGTSGGLKHAEAIPKIQSAKSTTLTQMFVLQNGI
jgi:hypothetical protein